jgi:hypothetical protein
MRNAVTVPAYLLQQDSEVPVDEFAARTHNMREIRPTTPESIRGDGGYVARIGGRLIPPPGESTALIVVIQSACTAQHCDEYDAPRHHWLRRQALKRLSSSHH